MPPGGRPRSGPGPLWLAGALLVVLPLSSFVAFARAPRAQAAPTGGCPELFSAVAPDCARAPRPPAPADTLRLTLETAVRTALERSPTLRTVRLEVADAAERVAEVRAELRPQLNAVLSYTRELASPNPFAGAPALGLLGTQAPTDWLFWNERARTDGDPGTQPIPLSEFRERQEAAFRAAGLDPPGAQGNPFAVANRFLAGLSFNQTFWDPAARAEVRAAEAEREGALAGARRQALVVADSVRQAYLSALLSQEQAAVLARSVARTEATVAEAAQRVAAGVAAVPERLSAEVELGNLRADWIHAATRAESALDLLRFTIGVPLDQPVVLLEALGIDDGYAAAELPLEVALARAAERRSDVRQARLALEAQQAREEAARARQRPTARAFAELNLIGNVPDDRASVQTDPLEPFQVEEERRGLFSSDFWGVGANVGVRLSWGLLTGGRLPALERRAAVAVSLAELRLEQSWTFVRLEVTQALREVRSAAERARIQEENVERAERNYDMVATRVAQGVAVPLERRDASEQLDRSRLGLAQARHDYVAALSRLQVSMDEGVGVGGALLDGWLW